MGQIAIAVILFWLVTIGGSTAIGILIDNEYYFFGILTIVATLFLAIFCAFNITITAYKYYNGPQKIEVGEGCNHVHCDYCGEIVEWKEM